MRTDTHDFWLRLEVDGLVEDGFELAGGLVHYHHCRAVRNADNPAQLPLHADNVIGPQPERVFEGPEDEAEPLLRGVGLISLGAFHGRCSFQAG